MTLRIETDNVLEMTDADREQVSLARRANAQGILSAAKRATLPDHAPLTVEEMSNFEVMAQNPPSYYVFRTAVDTMKFRRGCTYPEDWWEKMINSGIVAKICGE